NFTVDPSTDDDYWLSVKKLTVKNNSTFTFAGNIDADEISIEAGSTLALHEAYWDDTANRYVMYSVAAKDVTINGTFNIQNDNELIIRGDGSLSVGTNESIVTGETPSIIFEKGITSVTGIVLYDDVGSEINPFPNTRSIKFTYYDNKWSFDEILYDYEIETWFFDGFFDKVEFALDNGAFSEAAYRNGLDVSDIEGKTEVVFKPTLADPSWGISVAHYSTNDGETWKPLTPNAQAGTYSMLLSEFTDSCRRVIVEIKSFGPQDGINFYGDLWRLSSIKYQLNGTGDLHDLDFHLAPEAYANANSITFTLTPKEGETLRRVTIGEGNDQVEVQLTNNSFTLTKDNEWAAVYNFDLEFEDGEPTPGPTADYEVDLRYPEDPADFNSITYWIDNGDPRDVDFNNHQHSIGFSNDDISQHDYLYFSAAPKDPSRTIVVRYIVPPANVDPKDWNWTTAQYDETALGYKIPLALFVDGVKTIAVDIYTDNAPGPQPTDPDYSFDVQYTSDLATGFSYKIDDGNWNYTGDNNHRLGLYNSDVTGHLTLYFQPNIVGDKSIKAQYGIPVWVENPDEPDGGHYEVQDWTDVYANTDGSFAFPLNRLSAQNNNFRIDFVEDSGDQPQPTGPSFSIVATGNNGGRITMSPAISVIHEDDEPDVYMYNCSDFNETNVEINADQGYYINRITVKINNGTPVELTNFDPYRYNYKPSERPEENDRIEINVLFATSDGKMVEDVIDHGYAYHDDTEDVTTKIANLEEYLASEIYFRYFREGMYSIAFANEDALKAALTAPESISNADDAVGLPYAAFTFDYNDIHETFKVYLLNGKHDFLVKVVYKNNNVEYLTIENAAWGSADHAYLVDDGIAYIQLFGNGVDSPGAFNIENSEIQASQGTQETSGFDYVVWEDNLEDKTRYTEPFVGEDGQQIGLINTRVILISKTQTNAALRVIGPEDCPGWAYGYIDTVTADSDRSKAKTDYIFMANRSVTIEDVQYMNTSSEPRITNVSIDSHYGLSSDSITVEKTKKEGAVVSYSFEVTFNTAYDMIHLALEYSDGITRYITLHRIAVMVDPSAVNLDNNNQITIEHGTSIWDWRHPYLNGDDYTFDHNDGNIAISATYYYSTGRTAPTSSDKVVLFVTIRKVDGTTETRSIRTPVKDDGTDRTRDDDLSNVYFDDFIVWAGPETEYHNIASVEIFAYNEGDGTVFGGVKAGSEHGYVWINDRDH
ncbi:MAG: hypothetical protein J6Z43_04140, partial [Clostridiales bacterium]|nr:hypothetical protein [Clostridiales bacterium]